MKEMRDPAIKLFGKEIALVIKTGDEKQGKEENGLDIDKDARRIDCPLPIEEKEKLNDREDDYKTPPVLEENGNTENGENENDKGNEVNNSDQKTLKKPDKILPCPRCNSMDTKFCYYNNYNINQPRHFCKGCQRYWTAGGTMRNVPVGAGRRKNKNSAPNCRHITISDSTNGIINPMYGTNGTVLSFGSEAPKTNPIFRNGILKMEKENGSDCSSGSSIITTSNSIERNASNLCGFNAQVPCLQGFPWPYPGMPNPGFSPPGYPIPVYPMPYWNCSVPGAWPVPWLPTPCGTNQKMPNPNPTSPLGKHSRNGELLNSINLENGESEQPKNSESTILIPKTLRIDDPEDAAKSSIWTTLGINNDSVNRKGLFKAFEQKSNEKKNYVSETPNSMQANPAAMSRSINFHETA